MQSTLNTFNRNIKFHSKESIDCPLANESICQKVFKTKITIVRDISIEIDKRKVVSIIGRNGVGKSNLMKGVMGLLPATSGTIHFDGKNITRANTNQRANIGIGYVP